MFRSCIHPGCPEQAEGRYCRKHAASRCPSVTLVCGPPASGKTTYVSGVMQHDDIVVDLDPIKQALAATDWYAASDRVLPFALAARDGIIEQLLVPNEDVRHAWLIGMYPYRHQRDELRTKLNANVIVLEVAEDVCMQRIAADERRRNRPITMWESLVQAWWQRYEPDPRDSVRRD